jgi:hypothetical protein
MRFNLTLAGSGDRNSGASGGSGFNLFGSTGSRTPTTSVAPPPPAAPPAADNPAMIRSAGRLNAGRGTFDSGRTGAENIRNEGGGRGLSTSTLARALKGLTGS